MAEPVKVIGVLTPLPGKAEALHRLLSGLVSASRQEPGNRRYDLWRSSDPLRFVVDELYADADANAAHRASPHYRSYLAQIGDLAERTAFILAPVDLAGTYDDR